MHGIRARVAKKAKRLVQKAQAAPPAGPPAAPGLPSPGPPAAGPVPAPTPAAPKPVGRPPGPAAPPGAPPGAPKPKEELEQEVEKDIRKQKETENKINDLDEKVNAISDQIEVLTKSINKLVNTIQKEKGGPTDFEKKFEEIKEEDDEDSGLSSAEFGLGDDDESLIVSKEGHKMSDKEKLRKARQERLQAKELTFEMKEMPNKKYKQQVPAPTITKLKDEPEDWGQYRLKASDMAMDLNAAGDEWAVVNKHTDQVFYKIQPTAETKDIFDTREFAETVINDVREMGLEEAMEKYGALPMEFLKKKKEEDKPKIKPKLKEEKKMPPMIKKKEVEEDVEEEACVKAKTAQENEESVEETTEEAAEETAEETAEEVTEEAAAEASAEEAATEEEVTEEAATEEEATSEEASTDKPAEPTASMADIQRRFVRAFRLALSAQQKNLADNPLKAAWYETLSKLDVPNPEKVIEVTFARSAAEHFEVTLMKTAEFLDLSDEAFVEMESQIGELNTQPPKTAEEADAEEQHIRSAKLRARAYRSSLPLSTATEDDPTDFATKIAGALPKPRLYGVNRIANK